jgi:hypothetical protein
MILSVSKAQTTLYDQIRYSGNPSSFAWVLPISGTVDVGLSADSLFASLENLTVPVVQAPPTHCPTPAPCPNDESFASGGIADASAAPPQFGGVDVLKQETVGPYETVQLRSTDANALTNWLTQNGFAIPADVKPIIDGYVAEKFDFLALKLLPGKDVQAMRPVRVTAQGASPVLPLRMVAAGTGAVVGVSLWVVAEGRYEPQNFPFFALKSDDLTWDWSSNTSNFKTLRATKTADSGGRAWEIESALSVDRLQVESLSQRISLVNPSVGSDYAPVEQNGQVTKTAEQVRTEDLESLFHDIPSGHEHVTRLRADLSHTALTTDLALVASADQTEIAQVRTPKIEQGQPICPIYNGCRQIGSAPRDEAIAQSKPGSGNGESFSCATATTPANKGTAPFAALGSLAVFFAFTWIRTRRARTR